MGLPQCLPGDPWPASHDARLPRSFIFKPNSKDAREWTTVPIISNLQWYATGMPPVPLDFVLAMEPLLRCLLTNAGINGIHIHSKEYKIVAFSDDLMLFLSDPLISLPNLIKDFKMFGSLSNLKFNYSKSYALNVSLPQDLVNLLYILSLLHVERHSTHLLRLMGI